MSSAISHAARIDRLARVASDCELLGDHPYLKVIDLPEAHRRRLRGVANIYLWESLCAWWPDRSFALTDDVLASYPDDVLALPNRTPNGRLFPRRDTAMSFNMVNRAFVDALIAIGVEPHLELLQIPINVRIVAGQADAAVESRPLASTKLHSDAWNGEPTNAFLFNLPLLGDPLRVGMRFVEATGAGPAFYQQLENYEDADYDGVTLTPYEQPFEKEHLFLSDGMLLHQTVKTGPGIRLSLDARAVPTELLDDESYDVSRSAASYIDRPTWTRAGREDVLVNCLALDAFQREQRGEPGTLETPVVRVITH